MSGLVFSFTLTRVTDWGFWELNSDCRCPHIDHPFNVGSSALVWKIRSSYHEHLEASLMNTLNKCPHRGKYAVAHLIGNVHMYIYIYICIGLSPFPVIVTTRIVSCLVGNPYKPSFATITGKGDNPIYIYTNFESAS